MGEMGKKNAEKAEQAIIAYLTNIGAAVKEKSHIGYVVSAYFSDFKVGCSKFESKSGIKNSVILVHLSC